MTALLLVPALLLDAAFGEPRLLWDRVAHPAVLMGRLVAWLERHLNTGAYRRAKGVLALAVLVVLAGGLGLMVGALPLGELWQVLIAAVLLAQKSLVQHVQAVADALRLSVGDGRLMVARIVGRDTAAMDQPAVARAAIESAAENLSDGVIAPAFWFLVAGLPGILIYKIVNTADSMIGHRTPRYEQFGWASARCDDVLNWVPARLTALLGLVMFGRLGDWGDVARDARLHRSPNAGWPEAAIARVLNIALSGPRWYHGTLRNEAFINPQGRHDLGPQDIDAALHVLWRIWAGALACVFVIGLVG